MLAEGQVKEYWRHYMKTIPGSGNVSASYDDTWHFGDTEELANKLADLLRKGEKTATSFLLWRLDTEGWKMPRVGDVVVVAYWDGSPACTIKITEVELRPFEQIDERFAYDYGEGERTLVWWRSAMWNYYSKEYRSQGREASLKMVLVCQRFRLPHR